MNRKHTYARSVIIACIFIWMGFVCAISFMEAWLKFRAQGVTLPIGLSIGQLVFRALNKVEWTLAFVISVCWLRDKQLLKAKLSYCSVILLSILIVQTFYLLPELNARIDLHLQNLDIPQSNLHMWYVLLEVLKVMNLITIGAYLLNRQ
jgi:hypothetical protein